MGILDRTVDPAPQQADDSTPDYQPRDMEKTDPIFLNLQRFATDHRLLLVYEGTIGFGRPCVGFMSRYGTYVEHNPLYSGGLNRWQPVPELADERLHPPARVVDAYHKHDCLAVLVHGGDYVEALTQLNLWVQHLESLGKIEIEVYETQAEGLQVLFSCIYAAAVKIKKED